MAPSDLTISVLLGALPLFATFLTLYTSYTRWLSSPTRKLPYAPGPPPVVLNKTKSVQQSRPWVTYTEWAKKYGDIIHCKVDGRHTIILNKYEDAVELFERRSGLYSDRIKNPLIDLMGFDFHVGLMPYGEAWRRHRKLFQQWFRAKTCIGYQFVQTEKVLDLLTELLVSPKDFRSLCKKTATSIILTTLYGQDLSPDTIELFCQTADQAIENFDSLTSPESKPPYFSILRHLPPWVPGAEFHVVAEETKELTEQMQQLPFDDLGKTMIQGISTQSLMGDLMESTFTQKQFDIVKHIAATSYAAGVDTTVSALLTFFLAMTLYPDVQKLAREEIDRVLGTSARLPTFSDRPKLPYVEALYREVMRWMPVFPLNAEHVSTDHDEYKGFYIPKGTNVIANNWAMTRDPEKYTNPEVFNPGRFLEKDGTLNDDDVVLAFGYGRRICPGRHIASSTIWLTIVSILSAFDIQKKKDRNGLDVPIELLYTSSGMIPLNQPLPFECSIKPRRVDIVRLIKRAKISS